LIAAIAMLNDGDTTNHTIEDPVGAAMLSNGRLTLGKGKIFAIVG